MKEIVYTLTAQIEGLREDELEDGEKGAGEARVQFEKLIRNAKFSASSTIIKTVSFEESG